MVARTIALMAICYATSIVFIWEQARKSMMSQHPSLSWLRKQARKLVMSWFSVDSYMSAFGGETLKPHTCYSSHSLVAELKRSHPGKIIADKQVCV